ncbi:MAG: cytochrome P450 [Chlamydiales bacterium]|jgi:cytochrome P450
MTPTTPTTPPTDTGGLPLPPGPAAPCAIDADLESFHRMWRYFEEFGGIYRVDPPGRDRPTYLVSDPDLVQRVLVTNWRNYAKGRGFERVKMLLGNGVIVSDGEHWLEQRRMIQPAFKREIIEAMSAVVRRANEKLLPEWEHKADRGETLDITHETSVLALDVILGVIFGDDLEPYRTDDGKSPFALLVDHPARDLALVVQFRALRELVHELIAKRRCEDVHRTDFLSLFMDARSKTDRQAMADEDLIDEIMTLIVAGHETTAATTNWIWFLLAQDPRVEAELHAELDPLAGDEPPSFASLDQMPYAKRVMFETLRLYPPVWLFTRKALGADELGGYRVDAGTDIFLSPYVVHRHPEFWGDDAQVFRPERFTPDGVNPIHEFAYFPFSMGARRCTGDLFAKVEALTHIGWMAPRFRLSYVPDRELELEPAVNLRTKHGIRMRIERR